MATLFERIEERVDAWRADGYPCDDFPAIVEILEWAGPLDDGELRYLRRPQVRALETYWYLRLVEGTPHVVDLYERLFPITDKAELIQALGVSETAFRAANFDLTTLWSLVETDDDFVKHHRLDALRETRALDYTSYILALAMGAGKTVLIGAIVATEFAMAIEYPSGPFVQNALVFAPGKTIIESLRELTRVPYDRILPPRLAKTFTASLKLTFTRDGEKDVPVVPRSAFNVVVTNTEKIRIRKETIRKTDIGSLYGERKLDDAKQAVANLRLQTIASLPHLAVFSDEAHHTYGQSMDKGLKRVRQTVDYLAANTNVICVVNTTGTPYFKRQPLRDVVVWYGLSQGIEEGILKELAGNIHAFEGEADAEYVRQVIGDFFVTYRDVALPDGSPAKIALYFPQIADLEELRPEVETALISSGIDPSVVLVNTSTSSVEEVEAFNRLNDPASPHRVILLVNKGTEGWNCPSLFSCALIRRLKNSNNFVLQAASRCLRQVPGNDMPARVSLSMDNYGILDKQLAETYGESIAHLRDARIERKHARLVLRKPDIPPLVVRQLRRTVVRAEPSEDGFRLERPSARAKSLTRHAYSIAPFRNARRALVEVGDEVTIDVEPDTADVYAVAVDLAAHYRLEPLTVLRAMELAYPDGEVPVSHINALAEQAEACVSAYEIHEEEVEVALALVKPEGFAADQRDGQIVYTTEIAYPKSKEDLLVPAEQYANRNTHGFGFHYDPYYFDSNPEEVFFEEILDLLDGMVQADDVEEVLFTGGITDPSKTDFAIEYRDDDGRWRRYTPDFVVRKRDGKVLIVEVKGENMRADPVNGERGSKAMAVREWMDLSPGDLRYEIVFAKSGDDRPKDLAPIREFLGVGAPTLIEGLPIDVDRARLETFCQKWGLAELAFFGSVLRDDFGPDSDVDVLYTFEAGKTPGLAFVKATEELESIIGRPVDMVSRKAIERSENHVRRRSILEGMEVVVRAS